MNVRRDLWEGPLQFYGVIHDDIEVTANEYQVTFWFKDIIVQTYYMQIFINMTKDLNDACWLHLANSYRDYLYLGE